MEKFRITDLSGAVTLNNGVKMPYFGLGVFKSRQGDEVISAVETALEVGYRHIDTAAVYGNEEGVGKAIVNSCLKREEVFVTSKLWNDDIRKGRFQDGINNTLDNLGFAYLDLYLIHWPVKGKFIDAWLEMEKMLSDGLVRAIGVSNFLQHHLAELMNAADVVPMVNQLKFHPHLQQDSLMKYCRLRGIQPEGWAPLMRGEVFHVSELSKIGRVHDKNAAQVALRWNLQKGVIAIPKSVDRSRIQSNADIFDFKLSESEMSEIDALDQCRRTGPDPDNFEF